MRPAVGSLLNIFAMLVVLVTVTIASQVNAQEENNEAPASPTTDLEADPLGKAIGGQIFFDAERSSFNKDLTRQIFEGNVVAIGAGTMISADYLSLDKNTNIVTAAGHIVVINRSVIFLGNDLTYHLATGDMKLGQASMYSSDPEVVGEATNKILGFTGKEVAFEADRQKRLREIRQLKDRIRSEARRQAIATGKVPEDLIDKFAVYLEQEDLIKNQENQSLARLSQEKRESYKRRREFWEASKKSGISVPSAPATTAYFHIEGETLVKVDGNDFYARNSLFTPCYCKPGESPAWAFHASEIEAQIGGYANLYHPVLEIKGIPILYLPWLKFPLKDRRQSGFLPPTFGYQPRSGNIFSQPVFLDLGTESDATLKTDIYEKRGTRIGVEYRLQQKEFSGWEMHAESIRDRLWLEDRELRTNLRAIYADDPDVSPATVNYYLNVPENTWRGSYDWRGVSFLAPRLSFVSSGQINSDHRYAEELYVPDDFEDLVFGGRAEPAFSTTKGQFHLDGRDFYLGLGTRFGDNYLSDERFEGQQLPLRIKAVSRYVSLLPDSFIVPLYSLVSVEHYRIAEYKSELEERDNASTLGGGSWRRLKADFVSPWVTDSIIQVNQFTDVEGRYIEHSGLLSRTSEIKSWRTGLEFRLPIDGKGELPGLFQVQPCTVEQAKEGECVIDELPGPKKNVHHIMDWRLRFSVRPAVVRVGPYTENLEPGGSYAYFTGDKNNPISDTDRSVDEEDRMREHRRVSLSTDQVWKLFNKDWRRIAALGSADEKTTPSAENSQDRARRELMFNLEKPVTSDSEIFDPESNQYLVDRYRLFEQYYLTPVTFHADVAYDFLDAETREKQKKEQGDIDTLIATKQAARSLLENQLAAEQAKPAPDLAAVSILQGQIAARDQELKALAGNKKSIVLEEPWKELNLRLGLNYSGFSLATSAIYNLYVKTAKSVGASLALPPTFKTNVSLGYSLDKTITDGLVTRTRVRSYRLATSLIPMVVTYASLSQKLVDGVPRSHKHDYKTAYGIRYDSDSKCWGLQFAREKDYDKEEREATYLLRFSMIFMGEQRHFPNMSPGLEREIKDDNES